MAEAKKDKSLNNLDALLKEIEQEQGKEVRIDPRSFSRIPRYPVDSPTIGNILGFGGLPKGRIVEVFGPEQAGKSTLAQYFGGMVQKEGKLCVYIDMEHAIDPYYSPSLGLDIKNNFEWFQPDSGEKALDLVIKFLEKAPDLVGIIIVDSVPQLVPQAELDGEMEDQQMGALARLMGKGMRKITPLLGKTDCVLLCINQIRQKIGVMFSNPETTPGGNALKYAASIRLDIRQVEKITGANEDDIIGFRSRVKAIKNKTAHPFKKGEIEIYYGRGIDSAQEYLNYGVSQGIFTKNGSWFNYGEERLGQGAKNAAVTLKSLPQYENLKEIIRQNLFNTAPVLGGETESSEEEVLA